jgi:transcriptional regulator with XRE-family HTH domain
MSQQQKENIFPGSRIAQLRKLHNMSMRGLARAAAIDVSYLSRLESGANTSPSRSVIERIAVALEATPEWILGGPTEIHVGTTREDRLREPDPVYGTTAAGTQQPFCRYPADCDLVQELSAQRHAQADVQAQLATLSTQVETLTRLLGATLAANSQSVAHDKQKAG